MTDNNYGFGGEGLWIFALLILMFMGGFGGLNGNNAIGYENLTYWDMLGQTSTY